MKRLMLLVVGAMFSLMLAGVNTAHAQCAQCAAQVETNAQSGDKTAYGLNNGIMYLLVMPYLVVAIAGFVWYKKYRKKNVDLQVRNEKLHLN